MKNAILFSILALTVLGCNKKIDEKSTNVLNQDSSLNTTSSTISESFFPENKETIKFDTLIASEHLHVTIIKTNLDSYVTCEYDDNGKKQIDKYRDAEIILTIKQNSQILLDTVFKKEQFSKYCDKGFMDIANFHNYWFNKIDNNRIELFGVISKPETDYTLDFYHYFDLTTKKLNFVEYAEDEE